MNAPATPVATMTVEEFGGAAEEFLTSLRPHRQSSAARTNDGFSLFRASSAAEADAARAWQRTVFDAGYEWVTGPVEYGGSGLSSRHERAYQAVERRFDVPSRAALGVSLGMVAPTLIEHGTDEAKRKWATAVHRGDVIGCQLFSEPGAGSDLAAVSTRATLSGDEWVIEGQKVWTSGAHYSDLGLLLARTSDDGRHRNLTAFIVDMAAPGVDVRPLRQMTGGADFNEVFLTGVRVPDWARLGPVGNGWQVAMTTLMYERGAIGGSVGGGSGLFRMDALARWLKDRGCADDPLIRQAYARVYAGVTAAKVMRSRAESSLKAGRAPGPEMSLSKLALVANLKALADVVSAALGPALVVDTGSPESFAWSEFVLGVPGMRLGGGTDEIQRNIIAKRVLGLPAS